MVLSCLFCRRLVLVADGHCNCHVKDLFYTILLFAAAFHVCSTHLLGDCAALLGGYRRQSLGFKELDAVLFVAQVRFQAEEHEGCGGAEVKDFGVPLAGVSNMLH